MQAARTAQIIRFPARKPVESLENGRLTHALTNLDIALAEQKAAIAAWRQSLTELRGVVTGLGRGLTEYQASLRRLDSDVTTLNSDARAMEAWADAAIAGGVAPEV
jgi:hypothetical protein